MLRVAGLAGLENAASRGKECLFVNPTLIEQIRRHARQRRNAALNLPSRSQHLRVVNPLEDSTSLGAEAIRLARVAVALHMAGQARLLGACTDAEARS